MRLTFFHWGLHAWSVYIVVGLSLAYFAFRHDLPLTIRSAFYPLLGDRIYGPVGNLVDTLAVFRNSLRCCDESWVRRHAGGCRVSNTLAPLNRRKRINSS